MSESTAEQQSLPQQKHTAGELRVSDTSLVTDDICVAVIEEKGEYAAPHAERCANAARLALCWNQHDVMELMLKLIQHGLARFEPSTKEFCFNGLRYGASDGDWDKIISMIGPTTVHAALRKAGGAP